MALVGAMGLDAVHTHLAAALTSLQLDDPEGEHESPHREGAASTPAATTRSAASTPDAPPPEPSRRCSLLSLGPQCRRCFAVFSDRHVSSDGWAD